MAGQTGSDALAQASAALHRHVEQARDGRFVVMPGKPMVGRKCAYKNCDFRTMCRLTRPGRRKSFEETDV